MSRMKNRRLTDILNGESREELSRRFQEAQAAEEYAPLPKGIYTAEISSSELTSSTAGKPGFVLGFVVGDGEHKGRRIWHTLWLTPPAMPMTKRDLQKIGITSLDQLERPVPMGIICKITVALRTDDDGEMRNRISRFEVVEVRQDSTADADFGGGDADAKEGGAA